MLFPGRCHVHSVAHTLCELRARRNKMSSGSHTRETLGWRVSEGAYAVSSEMGVVRGVSLRKIPIAY